MNALEVLAGLDWWTVAGWTMLHYLWLGLLTGAVAALLRFALRRTSANVRYGAALVCLAALAVLPAGIGSWMGVGDQVSGVREGGDNRGAGVSAKPQAATVAVRSEGIAPGHDDGTSAEPQAITAAVEKSIAPEPALGVAPAQVDVEPIAARQFAQWSAVGENAARWLPWVWIVGAPVTFLLLATGVIGAERLRRESRLLNDGPVLECVERLRTSLAISRRVAVAVCERVAAPVLVGIVRPLVLLPPAALTGWSPEEIEMVLLHELAHVRRWDNLVNLLQRLVEAALFFQPAVWLVSGWARREREACCDAVVVGRTQRPQAYAELLVALAAQLPRSVLFHPAASSAMAAGPLRGRIRRILAVEDDPMLISGKSLGVVMSSLLVAATLVVLNLPARSEAEQKPDLTTEGTESTEGKAEVQFVVGASRFDEGDKISIRKVRGTASDFGPGGTYWIEGSYTLASRDRASLSAFVTAKNAGDGKTSIDQEQTMTVERGSGKFSLKLPMPYEGWPHVSFHPDGGGEGFGGVYFGTGDSVLKKWWDAYGSGGARSVESIATVDRVKETAANPQVYWSKSTLPGGEFDLQPLFVASDENPLLTMSYPVPPSLQKNLSLGFEAMKLDPFGPKLKFESRWIDDRSAFEITAPKQAHVFFSNFVPWVIAAEGKRSAAAASDAESFAEKSATEAAENNGVAYRKQVGVGGNLPVEVSKEDERRIVAEVLQNPAVRSASIKRAPNNLQMLVTSVVPPPGKKAFLTWKTDSEGRLSCSIEFVVPPKLAEKTQSAERGRAELAPITIAENAKSSRSDEETRRVTLGIRENQTATAESEPGRLRLQIRTTESAKGKFPTLDEQKLADLIWKRLNGLELEPLTAEQLKKVKELGYEGGLRNSTNNASGLQQGDILVGLHVWPTTSLQDVVNVLNREDIPELNPLKYYVVRISDRYVGGASVDTGRIVVNEKIPAAPTSRARQSDSQRRSGNAYEPIPIPPLTEAEKTTLRERGPVRLQFYYAPDSEPCRRGEKLLTEIQTTLGDLVQIERINVVDQPGLAAGQNVHVIPTMILYWGNEKPAQVSGAYTVSNVEEKLARLVRKPSTPTAPATNLRSGGSPAEPQLEEELAQPAQKVNPAAALPSAVALQPASSLLVPPEGETLIEPGVPVPVLHQQAAPTPLTRSDKENLRKGGPIRIEIFYAPDNGPSSQAIGLIPVYQKEFPGLIEVKRIDVTQDPITAAKAGLGDVLPAYKLYHGDIEIQTSLGLMRVRDLEQALVRIARQGTPTRVAAARMALRYDGKTFDEWRTAWQTELSTERRIEAVKALAAFGRAGNGYAKEAAAVILNVAGEYDFTIIENADDPEGVLKRTVIDVLAPESRRQVMAEFWLPDLAARLEKEPARWKSLAYYLLDKLQAGPAGLETLQSLAKNGPDEVRLAALGALVRSERLASGNGKFSDSTRALLAAALSGNDPTQARPVLPLLLYHPNAPSWKISQGIGPGIRLNYLPEFVPLLFAADESLRQQARFELSYVQDQDAGEILGKLTAVLDDEARTADHVEAIRAIAAMGPAAVAATPELKKIALESKDEDTTIAALVALASINNQDITANLTMGNFSADQLLDTLWNAKKPLLTADGEHARLKEIDELRPRLEREAKVMFSPPGFGTGGGMF